MAVNLAFDASDWERIARDWTGWWQGELRRPLVVIEGYAEGSEAVLAAAPDFTSDFPLDVPVDQVLDCYERRLAATRYYGDAFPKWWPNYGPGSVAGYLGAEVHCAPDTVWFTPAADTAIDALHVAYAADNPWWQRTCALTAAAVARWGSQVAVGHTDLGGDLDVLASLRTTQSLLLDLTERPTTSRGWPATSRACGNAITTSSVRLSCRQDAGPRRGRRSGLRGGVTCCSATSPTCCRRACSHASCCPP